MYDLNIIRVFRQLASIKIKPVALTVFFTLSFFFYSCEKDITVTLPQGGEKIVVEGHIEQNQPPYIILTKTVSYFAPTDLSSFSSMFIHDARIVVSDGVKADTLIEYCANEIDTTYLNIFSDFLGIPINELTGSDYCIYSIDILDFLSGKSIKGSIGGKYELRIYYGQDTLTSTTTIPNPVFLDSVWFGVQKGYEPLGWAWARLPDPDTMGNSYRWFSKLSYESNFWPPEGSAFTDQFFNGQTIDFFYDKPNTAFSGSEHEGLNSHMYTTGDTIIIKFCTVDLPHFFFLRSYETSLYSNSNPFATPTPVKSNIKGGIGIWGGYAVTYDTIIVK